MKNPLIFPVLVIIFTGSFYVNLAKRPNRKARVENCQNELFPEPDCCGRNERSHKELNERIKGGADVERNEYPWLALILPVQCGGSLINSQWVLSAAHCFDLPDAFEVKLGALKCDEDYCEPNAETFSVKKVYKHEHFHKFKNDIALLKLKKPVTFSDSIKPICLPFNDATSGTHFVGRPAVVAGWGYFGKGEYSPVLKSAIVPVWDTRKCKSRINVINEQYHICAGGEEGIDACDHDSGGPLFLKLTGMKDQSNYYQIGVVSFGQTRCGKKGIPGVYERVTTHIKWIKNTISKHK